jgi:hypothetical protein
VAKVGADLFMSLDEKSTTVLLEFNNSITEFLRYMGEVSEADKRNLEAIAVAEENKKVMSWTIDPTRDHGEMAKNALWVIDQMLRHLLGMSYPAWVASLGLEHYEKGVKPQESEAAAVQFRAMNESE